MVSHEVDTIRTIIGIIGNVISGALFLSPMPTFWRICRNKSTEEFQPYPYLATVMNCMMWIFYGLPLVHPHSVLVVTINGVGLGLEIIYLIIFLIYSTTNKKRLHIVLILLVEVAAVAGIAAVTLLKLHTYTSRSNVVGGICTFFGVIMYSAPLGVMKKVIKTKSVEFMPLAISVTCFANGVCWTIYALLEFDPYILTGNGLGAIISLAQLILYLCYFRTPESLAAKNAKKKTDCDKIGV